MEFTLSQSKGIITGLRKATNQASLDIFGHLFIIESKSLWTKKGYYEGNEELYNFIEAPFNSFLKGVLGITPMWYQSMKNILDLPEGHQLFLRFGRSNLATYLNSTEEERKAILVHAKESQVITSFSNIKKKLFPGAREVVINPWREKYTVLKAKYDALEKAFKEYKSTMQETIRLLISDRDDRKEKEN